MYDAIIYEAKYGRTLTIKWPPVPHPWYIRSQKWTEKLFYKIGE